MNDSTTTTARKGSVRTTVAIVAAAGLLSGVALAAVSANGKMQGSIGRGQFLGVWSGPGVLDLPGDGTNPANTLSADKTTLILPTGVELYEGESATTALTKIGLFTDGAMPTKTGNKSGYVQGLTGTIGAGWKVSLATGCGDPVAAPNSTAAYVATPVAVKIEALPSASPADPLSLNGLQVVIAEGTNPGTGLVCEITGS